MDANGVGGGGVDAQYLPGLPRPRGPGTFLLDDALLDQPADDDRNGLGREACLLGDLDPAGAVRRLDGAEHDIDVVSADPR